MEVYGRHHNRPWFDQNGAFSPTEYLKDATSNDTTMLAQVVNRWYAVQGSNGWKNLTDDEIRLVQSAVSKITDYAGPADYDNHNFLPKFQLASNSETYAELHPVMLMKMEKFMRKLNEKERRAVERLHAEMIAWARSVMNRTSAGG